ncbi:MAG: hypothetical protein ACKORI_03345, partial [Verrucomicrobiota bacterium]
AVVAFVITLVGLLPEWQFSLNEPSDLLQVLFFLAPSAPFLVLGGVVMAVKDRYLLTGLLVIAVLLTLSCGFYLLAQADQRAHPEALFALIYLMVPFLQAAAAAVAFGILVAWRALRQPRG